MSQQLVYMDRVLYNLRKLYGVTIQIERINSQSFDPTTGKIALDNYVRTVKKVILLPESVKRDFVYDLAFIAANKNFTYGGLFDVGEQTLIIEHKSLPQDYELSENDHIHLNGERFEIKRYREFMPRKLYIVVIKRVVNDT